MSFIDASLASIIHALNPVMILVFAMLLLRERCSVPMIVGICIAVVCSAGSNLWWSKGLQLLPASTCSMSYPIMPLTTAVIGVIFLHEPLSLNLVIGGLLILAGLMLAVMAENQKNGQKPEEKS